MTNKTTIYGLYSTRNKEIRYVGKSNNPKSRLKDHIWSSKSKRSNTHKSCWIRREIDNGYDIEYKILEICDISEWVSKEIKYISEYKNLTNHNKGGLGGSPIKYNMTYKELKEWCSNTLPKKINSKSKWKIFIKEKFNGIIPLNPNKVYHDYGWVSWAEFLNTNNHKVREYVTYIEFKRWVNDNVKNYTEFRKMEKPNNIPSKPERTYKNDWIGWIGVIPNSKNYNKEIYWTYVEAKKFLNDEYGDITVLKFKELCRNNILPTQIPKKPNRIYCDFSYINFLRK